MVIVPQKTVMVPFLSLVKSNMGTFWPATRQDTPAPTGSSEGQLTHIPKSPLGPMWLYCTMGLVSSMVWFETAAPAAK
jgi:hypothetical protein